MQKAIPDLVEGCPNVERWAKEVGARPATQRALKF
jgi:glutathione S-transferase